MIIKICQGDDDNVNLIEYIQSINNMLEAAKEESSEVNICLEDLELLFFE